MAVKNFTLVTKTCFVINDETEALVRVAGGIWIVFDKQGRLLRKYRSSIEALLDINQID